jgi:hypothetical protein
MPPVDRDRWVKSMTATLDFLERIATMAAPVEASADEWRNGMRRHYKTLAERLLSQAPPNTAAEKKSFTSRLRRL